MRRQPLLLLLALAAALLAGCGGNGSSQEGAAVAGPVEIAFWHSETASAAQSLERLVDRFNTSQDQVHVSAIYQGNEVELSLKLINGMPGGNVPAIAWVFESSAQTMIDSGQVVPVQEYVDRDNYDLSDFSPAALAYYSPGGRLYAMPVGITVPLLYYNKIPLREAGLDPEHPPRDLDEARAMSSRLLVRDDAGAIARTGMALEIEAWYLEFELAGAGQAYVDNDNGRQGRATRATFDGDAGRTFFRWWHDMIDDGFAVNIGRDPSHANGLLAIGAKRAGMTLSSSGALRSVIDVLQQGIEGVDLGVAPVPGIPGALPAGSPGVAGRGLWLLSSRPQAERDAAWTFVRWLLEPAQQAEWFAGSGYLPVRNSAYDQPAARDIMDRYPEFRVPVDIFARTGTTSAELGPLLGPLLQEREIVIGAIESMVAGDTSPDQALAAAADGVNRAIRDYNERVAP